MQRLVPVVLPPMRRLVVVLLSLMLASCLDSRDRLEPPRIYLRLDPTTVAPGGQISGVVSAADASGITYIRAQLAIEGDTARPLSTFAGDFQQDTVEYAFRFTVPSRVTRGTRLFITGTVRDDQNFEVTTTATTVVR